MTAADESSGEGRLSRLAHSASRILDLALVELDLAICPSMT